MKTLIKGGKVVTAIETMNADVMIVDEKVVGLVDSDSDISRSFSEDALVILMAVAYPNYRHTFHKSEDVSQANAQDTAILIDGIFFNPTICPTSGP